MKTISVHNKKLGQREVINDVTNDVKNELKNDVKNDVKNCPNS